MSWEQGIQTASGRPRITSISRSLVQVVNRVVASRRLLLGAPENLCRRDMMSTPVDSIGRQTNPENADEAELRWLEKEEARIKARKAQLLINK